VSLTPGSPTILSFFFLVRPWSATALVFIFCIIKFVKSYVNIITQEMRMLGHRQKATSMSAYAQFVSNK